MNIRCPHCDTLYRIDPERIPAHGIRVSCARCSQPFPVHQRLDGGAPAPGTAPAPVMDAAPAAPVSRAQTVAPEPAGPTPAPRMPPFGPQDPHVRAQRLARALISDIVAYHPERRQRSLAAGSLRTDFREEILKSWEEFVAQVGDQVARETPYFRDALNEILAGGRRVF